MCLKTCLWCLYYWGRGWLVDIMCNTFIFIPRCMRESYGSRSVCLSVTKLAATYLICESKVQCYKAPYGVPNACIVWILLKWLSLSISASFADAKLLDFSPSGTQLSIYTKSHVFRHTHTLYMYNIMALSKLELPRAQNPRHVVWYLPHNQARVQY